MSILSMLAPRPAPRAVTRSARLPRRSPAAGQAAAVIGTIVVAYHYTLSTLARGLGLDTPLAYLGLVPVIALTIGAGKVRPLPGEPLVHDRQLDYIVGVPLLAGALLMVVVLPDRLSTMFWVWRLDVLSLPLFAAGVVTIAYGARTLWRTRIALLFLALAWPVPYTWALGHLLDRVTAATVATVRAAVGVIEIAQPVPGQPALFAVAHRGGTFELNVASACAGVNGVVGFALLGIAFGVLVRGSRVRKAVWLLGGMGLLWMLNAARILMIFEAGRRWGEDTAIEVFHPYLGLVLFNLGALVMVLAMPRFRLVFVGRPPLPAPPEDGGPPPAVPRFRLALAVLAASSLVVGAINAGFRDYALVAGDLGEARLSSFVTHPPTPAGWHATEIDRFGWGRQYFGRDSTWVRFRYTVASRTLGGERIDGWSAKSTGRAGGRPGGPLQPGAPRQLVTAERPVKAPALDLGAPVYVDVITTPDLASLSTYGVEACYRFHGYTLHSTGTADLGGGITADVIRYTNTTTQSDWTAVSWMWPVLTPAGTRYERITLLTSPPSGRSPGTGDAGHPERLVDLGRQLVAQQATEGAQV